MSHYKHHYDEQAVSACACSVGDFKQWCPYATEKEAYEFAVWQQQMEKLMVESGDVPVLQQ